MLFHILYISISSHCIYTFVFSLSFRDAIQYTHSYGYKHIFQRCKKQIHYNITSKYDILENQLCDLDGLVQQNKNQNNRKLECSLKSTD